MKLYTFYRSSAAYRVRIALNLKALDYESIPVSLADKTDPANPSDYRAINPQEFVPTLEDQGHIYTQSLAIIEYLEETYPDIPLLPESPSARAQVRSMAQIIACDIHPLNNLRVLLYLQETLKQKEEAVAEWYRHWITESFRALEQIVTAEGGDYCFGDTITLADVCLIPQVANARRFDTDLTAFKNLVRIDALLAEHPAFQAAAPAAQPDAPAEIG